MVKYLSHQPPSASDMEDPDLMGRFLAAVSDVTEGSWFTAQEIADQIKPEDLPLRLRISLNTNAPGYTKSFGRALCYGGEISGDLEVETYARGKKGRVYRIVRKEDHS
jgi:hypothetical protein